VPAWHPPTHTQFQLQIKVKQSAGPAFGIDSPAVSNPAVPRVHQQGRSVLQFKLTTTYAFFTCKRCRPVKAEPGAEAPAAATLAGAAPAAGAAAATAAAGTSAAAGAAAASSGATSADDIRAGAEISPVHLHAVYCYDAFCFSKVGGFVQSSRTRRC
jgi:hypothetical protein